MFVFLSIIFYLCHFLSLSNLDTDELCGKLSLNKSSFEFKKLYCSNIQT